MNQLINYSLDLKYKMSKFHKHTNKLNINKIKNKNQINIPSIKTQINNIKFN